MTLLERRTKEAEETQAKALVVGVLRLDEDAPGDRYSEIPTVSRMAAVKKMRLTKIPFGDGTLR